MRAVSVGHPFSAIDAQPNPDDFVHALDTVHREPLYRAYKKRITELMGFRPGCLYLEVGTGTGEDARRVTEESGAVTVACDLSRALAAEARRRHTPLVAVADGTRLPFGDGTFSGCWADRTIQHVADPMVVLREMLRVTRPGGRIVVADPDYDTQVMELPDQALARRVFRLRADCGIRNGTIAHQVAGILIGLGAAEVQVESTPIILRDPAALDGAMGLRSWAAAWHQAGRLTATEVECWESLYDLTVAEGRFLYSFSLFITSAVAPPQAAHG